MINRVSDYEAKPGLHASLARYFKSLEQHLSDLNIHVLSGGKKIFTTGNISYYERSEFSLQVMFSLCLEKFFSIRSFEN